jgi:hypothetical protein
MMETCGDKVLRTQEERNSSSTVECVFLQCDICDPLAIRLGGQDVILTMDGWTMGLGKRTRFGGESEPHLCGNTDLALLDCDCQWFAGRSWISCGLKSSDCFCGGGIVCGLCEYADERACSVERVDSIPNRGGEVAGGHVAGLCDFGVGIAVDACSLTESRGRKFIG